MSNHSLINNLKWSEYLTCIDYRYCKSFAAFQFNSKAFPPLSIDSLCLHWVHIVFRCLAEQKNFLTNWWVAVIKKVSEAVIFMAMGAALFAANPRVGQAGGLYLFSCTASFGFQWSVASNKPVLLRSKPKFCSCWFLLLGAIAQQLDWAAATEADGSNTSSHPSLLVPYAN